jgi:SpoVK/Ycf46/Vps4 family AAA+-type ATPase
MNKTVDEIDVLLRAGYPILYVVSHEERRVSSTLIGIVAKHNSSSGHRSKFFEWSCTEGTSVYEGDSKTEQFEGHDNPLEILDFIESYKKTGVFMLKDFGHFLNEGPAYLVQRKLRDVASKMGGGITIIIVDSELTIPPRLEKLITVVDFELPSRSDIEENGLYLLKNCRQTSGLSDGELAEVVERGSFAAMGMTLHESENIFAKSLAKHGTLHSRTIMDEKKNIIRKSGVLEYYDVQTDMSDVGGLGLLKDWLNSRSSGFSSEAHEFGLPNPKGVLIIGIPGTGKSLISKCIGYEWNMPVLKLDVGSLFGSLVGQSEANIRKAIRTAEALAPCVLWIDELEKGFGNTGGGGDSGTSARVFGSFLSWMQDKKSPVFVVATANDVSSLPPEMLRKGRFDELFFVDLPSSIDREEIFDIHLRRFNKPLLEILDEGCPPGSLTSLIEGTRDFSGAEIEQVIIDGMFKAFSEHRDIRLQDLLDSASRTIPLSSTMETRIEKLRRWADGRAVRANDRTSEICTRSKRRRFVG